MSDTTETKIRAYDAAIADAAKVCADAACRLISNGRARVNQVDRHTAEVLRSMEARITALKLPAGAVSGDAWHPIATAPHDRPIWIYAPPYDDGAPHPLPAIQCACTWNPDGGFCVCELREPTHWREMPAPPGGGSGT